MKIIVTRNMNVAGEGGTELQFVKRPDVQEVPDAVGNRLIRAGAARKADEPATTDTSDATIQDKPVDLSGLDVMSKDELLAFAKTNTVDVKPTDTKDEIKTAILAKLG